MKNRTFAVAAVMAGFLALATTLAFAGSSITVVNTNTSDNITVVNTDTSPTLTPVAGGTRAEAFAELRAEIVAQDAEIICEREFSVLIVDYENRAIVAVYILDAETYASDGLRAKPHVTDENLRTYAQQLCDAGILETFEQDIDDQL